MQARSVLVRVAVTILAVSYAANVVRNVHAADRIASACDALQEEPNVPDALRAVPLYEEVVGDTLIADLRRENAGLCTALATETSWYRWNWWRTFQAPNDDVLVGRIDEALHVASTRCTTYARWSQAPGEGRSGMELQAYVHERCGWIGAASTAHFAQQVSLPVWEWPLVIEKIAGFAKPDPWPEELR